MTWLDFALVFVWLAFLGIGARYGGLWSASCVMGGFAGAFLADTYALPLSQWLGGFPAAEIFMAVVLFAAGACAFVVPGYILRKITGALFLGLLDGVFGLFAGALVGLVALSLLMLLIGPSFSSIERADAWKKSVLVKPFDGFVDGFFDRPRFQADQWRREMKKKATKKMHEIADDATDSVKDAATGLVDDLRNK